MILVFVCVWYVRAHLATTVSTSPWPGGRLVTERSGLAPDTDTSALGAVVRCYFLDNYVNEWISSSIHCKIYTGCLNKKGLS